MSTTTRNEAGAPRKQLSEQLDRLDGVIDALDEGLKGAVADAVREAVGAAVNEAIQAVLLELMTNPDLKRVMRQAATGPAEGREEDEKPKASGSLLSRLWGKACSAASACIGGIGTALSLARVGWRIAGSKTKTLVLAGVAAALYAARHRVAGVARRVADFVVTNGRQLLGRLVPRLAR